MSADLSRKQSAGHGAALSGQRILYVANALEPDAPTRLLAEIAQAAVESGAQCWFAAWSRGGKLTDVIEESLRTTPVVLGRPNGGDFAAARALLALLRKVRPHLVHVTLTRPSLFVPPMARLMGNPRIVVTQNGVHEWKEGRWVPEPLVRWGFRFAATCSDVIVGVSRSIANRLREFGVCAPEKLRVIPNGVDTKVFCPEQRQHRREILRSLFPDDNAETILLVGAAGNLRPIKNYQILIKAAAELRSREQLRFVIWGEGNERTALENLAKGLGLAKRLILPGWCDEVPKCLAACDCFVHPARSEAFGLAVAEAMASGVPVIASPVGGLLDLIQDGESGLFAPVEDPHSLALLIDYLAQRPSLRQKLAAAARQRIEAQFSTARMVAQYLQTYITLLNKSS